MMKNILFSRVIHMCTVPRPLLLPPPLSKTKETDFRHLRMCLNFFINSSPHLFQSFFSFLFFLNICSIRLPIPTVVCLVCDWARLICA
jgi:hypothetical protein